MKQLPLLLVIALVAVASTSALTIDSPLDNQTTTNPVDVRVIAEENNTQLSYQVTSNQTLVANNSCENCTSINDSLNLSNGLYELLAIAHAQNTSTNQSIVFTVNTTKQTNESENTSLAVTINHPQNTTYRNQSVPLNVSTTQPATISYALNSSNQTLVCENCTSAAQTLNLSPGNYTLTVLASANTSVSKQVVFRVNQTTPPSTPTNDTNNTQNETATNEFGPVFNKLPQALSQGEVTDAQVARILQENQLPPGIINRLVKTGQLGEESIDAIIEHQATPPGIFRRVLGFLGVHIPTPKERLNEEYNLTVEQQTALITQEDVTVQTVSRVREELEQKRVVPRNQETPSSAREDNQQTRRPAASNSQQPRQQATPNNSAAQRGPPDFAQKDQETTTNNQTKPAKAKNNPGRSQAAPFEAGGTPRGPSNPAKADQETGATSGTNSARPASPGRSGQAPGRNR